MACEPCDTFNGFFKQATETFQTFVNTGVRFQEEMSKFMTEPFGRKSFEDARRFGERFTTDAIQFARQTAAEGQKTFEAQCTAGADLARRAFESVGTMDQDDIREKTMDLWQTTFNVMRTTAENTAKSQMRVFEGWTNFMNRSFTGETN